MSNTSSAVSAGTANFKSIAFPFIQLGIPVFPLIEREKLPPKNFAFLSEASTDPAQIEAWNEENPHYNVALLAQPDGFCFLEFDISGGMSAAAKEMGQQVPKTRIQKSGKGFGHYIFKHTERSCSLGNRSVNLPDPCADPTCSKAAEGTHHHEWFSFRGRNKYLVGAGSIHPNGNQYLTMRDVEPIPIPDWVCDWIEQHSVSERPTAKPEHMVPVHDDFDFDDLCEFFDINVLYDSPTDPWKVVECPGVNRMHEHSTRTGFYFDGEHLGWSCFAQSCPTQGMSIGQLVKYLNEQKGEPYRGVIWSDESDIDFSDLEIDEADADEASPSPEPTLAVPAAATSRFTSLTPADPLRMPKDCMYGRLGVLAEEMHMEPGIAYPSLLTVYSALPEMDEMDDTRINLYCCLVCRVGGGKDTAIDRAIRSLGLDDDQHVASSPSSDRGLGVLIGDQPGRKGNKERVPGPRKILLHSEEMIEVLQKGGIDKSSLFQTLNYLWDHNKKVFADRNGKQTVNYRLSWIGGIPVSPERPEDFKQYFSAATTTGLMSRMLLGYSPVKFNHRKWQPKPHWDERLLDAANYAPVLYPNVEFSPEANLRLEQWRDETGENDPDGRIFFMLKKVALLSASANGDQCVGLECLSCAERFMAWQMKLRQVFKPNEALPNNREAEFANVLLPALEEKGALEQFISWRRIALDRKWDRKWDAGLQTRTVDNLVKLGRLVYEEKSDDSDPSGKKTKKTAKVMIRK